MPPNTKKYSPIQAGDTVAYNDSYLARRTSDTAKVLNARGTVTAVHRIADGTLLADVDWDTAGLPKRVFVKDLANVK